MKVKNPKTTFYEFGGPIGCIFVILGLPIITFCLYSFCNQHGCPPSQVFEGRFDFIYTFLNWNSLWSMSAFVAVLSWIGFQLVLYWIVPGEQVHGTVLRNGDRLLYKINAFSCLLVTIACIGITMYYYSIQPLLWIANHYLTLSVSATVFSFLLSLFLYLYSYRSDKVLLAEGGNSGYPTYDFWIGRELNPRFLLDTDLKYFCELRPG